MNWLSLRCVFMLFYSFVCLCVHLHVYKNSLFSIFRTLLPRLYMYIYIHEVFKRLSVAIVLLTYCSVFFFSLFLCIIFTMKSTYVLWTNKPISWNMYIIFLELWIINVEHGVLIEIFTNFDVRKIRIYLKMN